MIYTDGRTCRESHSVYAAVFPIHLVYVGCQTEQLTKRFNKRRYEVRHNNRCLRELAEHCESNGCNFEKTKDLKLNILRK